MELPHKNAAAIGNSSCQTPALHPPAEVRGLWIRCDTKALVATTELLAAAPSSGDTALPQHYCRGHQMTQLHKELFIMSAI